MVKWECTVELMKLARGQKPAVAKLMAWPGSWKGSRLSKTPI